jgi:hypothetical protein
LVIDETYTELGASATDNSGETMSVILSGSVNTSIAADYTITYTATDSSGNVHAISRLIYVTQPPQPTLQFSNPTMNLFEHSDYYNTFFNAALPVETRQSVTKSGDANAYLNGLYGSETGSYSSATRTAFACAKIGGGLWMSDYGHIDFVSSDLGQIVSDRTNGVEYEYRYTNASTICDYLGLSDLTIPNSAETTLLFSQLASNGTTYFGNYVSHTFPFLVDLSKFEVTFDSPSGNRHPITSYMLASDDGVNFDLIREMVITPANRTMVMSETFSSLPKKYSTFKFIINEMYGSNTTPSIYKYEIFGDIWRI